jgi:predicted dehydrogenase
MIEKREVLRAGVIGAGVFGGYHAAKYASLPGVVLAGVYDHHRVHAESLAARCGGQVYASEEALIADVDIV